MESYSILRTVTVVRDGPAAVLSKRVIVETPEHASRVAQDYFLRSGADVYGVETFGALLLSIRHRLIGALTLSVGCLTASLVHPREVFAAAIAAKSAGVVCFHNHPSGDAEPSQEDVALTRRLASGGLLLGIELLDHVVLGPREDLRQWPYVSMKQRGIL